jgi:hypothetical protein
MNIKKRIVLGAAVGTTVFGSVFGLAAGLNVYSADKLGSGAAPVTSCDTNGVRTQYVYSASGDSVTSVAVDEINENCDGAQLHLSVSDSGNYRISGQVTVETTYESDEGNWAMVALEEPMPASLISNVNVTLHGGNAPSAPAPES